MLRKVSVRVPYKVARLPRTPEKSKARTKLAQTWRAGPASEWNTAPRRARANVSESEGAVAEINVPTLTLNDGGRSPLSRTLSSTSLRRLLPSAKEDLCS